MRTIVYFCARIIPQPMSAIRRLVFVLILLAVCASMHGQRKIVVVSIETLLPIKGVSVRCDRAPAVITDRMGEAVIRQVFDSISFSHVEFASERLAYSELADTMFLFPLRYSLDEVVVTGIGPDLRRQLNRMHENQIYARPVSGLTFNFGLILDRRTRRDRKHWQKAQEVLRKWDDKM